MNRETITLPRLHTLTVLVDLKDGSRIYLRNPTGAPYLRITRTVKDGRATFENLTAGKYLVSALRKLTSVEVPAQTEVRIE
jgi:hypothetical protein